MAGESDDLDKLFGFVADGESLDWDALEREAPDEESRALIRQLRLIADVAEVHRSQVDEVTPPDVALTVPAIGGVLPILPAVGRRVLPDLKTTPGGAARPGGNRPPGRLPPGALLPGESEPDSNYGTWGHLLLVRKIGEGSYGEVYHAHDTWLDHPVALKLLKPEAESRVPPAQLLHEARKLARVRHMNVVTVHGADRHNGRVGFWMDFIDGDTLATRVSRGSLSAGEATSVGQEICRALAAVHRANIIHRDVKAQNVMRAHDGGRIILMDFGAGEYVGDETTNPQGTPLYMAPELFRSGERASATTDIYAVGVLLFHLVTNAFPVSGGSMRELREAHARGKRRRLRDERPDLPESFVAAVEKAIHLDPDERYQSAGEMEARLTGETKDPPPPPPKPDLVRIVAILGVGAIALTGVLGFIAARSFDVALQVDPEFALGIWDTVKVGAKALWAFVVIWMVIGVALGALMALVRLFVPSLSKNIDRLIALSKSWDPVTTATCVVLVGAISWMLLNVVFYAHLFTPLLVLAENPSTQTDLSLLGPAGQKAYTNHYLVSAAASLLVGFTLMSWFPSLEARATRPATIRGWKWAAAIVAFLFMASATVPRRIVWERHPVIEFDNRTGFVIGSAGEESLVYAPGEPGRPRRRILNESGVRKTGETRFLFDDGQSN